MTQSSLNTVQNEVSTGLSVANASDNAGYWSISQQLNQDNGVVTAANTALTEGQSMLSTATSAIKSVITTLNAMATQLTQAQNPNANLTSINTTLASLGSQLTDAINNASFNGLNLLNGSVTTTVGSTSATGVNFVSGYNATSNGGTVNTIGMATQVLYGTTSGSGTLATTTSQVAAGAATTLVQNEAAIAAASNNTTQQTAITDAGGGSVTSGQPTAVYANVGAGVYETQSLNTSTGQITQTIYTGTGGSSSSTDWADWTSFTQQTSVYTPASTGMLIQSGTDLTQLGSTSAGEYVVTSGATSGQTLASAALAAVNSALTEVSNYATTIGATQDRMTAASNFNSDLNTDYSNGVAGLVDANMNTASTQLQALQTQEQLGIQSLSIANQNSQLILKLFS